MRNPLAQLPLLSALKDYDRESIKGDLTAGLTTAVMLVPQGMAYAMLAGLEPIIGLYAATLPTAIYALIGSSRVLAVGPVAMVSLLVAGGVAPLAGADPVLYAAYATLLMLMVGAMQFGMGMARLGFLVKYLSHPVIAGFTWAAALIIGFSQFKHVLGVPIERSHHIHSIIGQAIGQVGAIHWMTLTIAIITIGTLLVLKKVSPRFPRFLLVVGLGTLAVWGFDLQAAGVAHVGDVPSGLPAFTPVSWDIGALRALFPTALAISLVAFMESIAVAKSFARQHGQTIDANQELRALGMANLGGAFFLGYPVTGGFSRTAVNAEAGAKSALAGLVTAVTVAFALLFLTPLFFFLPKAVLAGIIMTAVFGLIDLKEGKHIWKISKADFALLTTTFFATLSLGIELGIGIGVVTSLGWFVMTNSTPHVAVLGRLPNSSIYRNIKRHPEAICVDGIVALRIDSPLFFANSAFLTNTIMTLIDENPHPVSSVVLDAAAIGSVDASGAATLVDVAQTLKDQDIKMWLCTVRGPVRDALKSAGLYDLLPKTQIVDRVQQAIDHAATTPVIPLAPAELPTDDKHSRTIDFSG
ncbi:MAG TPA: sulfate permease [Myxococcales bacterium]|nr:sulfate permease [Myxococcales bacterium]